MAKAKLARRFNEERRYMAEQRQKPLPLDKQQERAAINAEPLTEGETTAIAAFRAAYHKCRTDSGGPHVKLTYFYAATLHDLFDRLSPVAAAAPAEEKQP